VTSNFIYRLIAGITPDESSAAVSIKPAVSYDMIPEFSSQLGIFYPPTQRFVQSAEKNQSAADSKNKTKTDNVDPSAPEKFESSTPIPTGSNNKTDNSFDRKHAIAEKDVDPSKHDPNNDIRASDVRILSKVHYIKTKGSKSFKYANGESSTIKPTPPSAQAGIRPDEKDEAYYNSNDDGNNHIYLNSAQSDDNNNISRTRDAFEKMRIATEKDDGNNHTYLNSAQPENPQSVQIESSSIVFPAKQLIQLEDKVKFHLASLKMHSSMTEAVRMQGSTGSEPTVTINIGRIEVRALEPQPSTKGPSSASLSLKDYLKQRSEGRPL
jgi:hypothetical protein